MLPTLLSITPPGLNPIETLAPLHQDIYQSPEFVTPNTAKALWLSFQQGGG